ncbi:MAG: hypothetical protein V4721_10560 [Bacteroidota bacterium]
MSWTQADMDKLQLKDNGDGTFSKPKTVLQPRDKEKFSNPLDPQQYRNNHKLTGTADFSNVQLFEKNTSAQLIVVNSKPEKKAKVIPLVYFNGMDIQDVYAKCEREGTIFIKGNVPSSKNAMVPFKGGMVYSKPTTDYKEQTDIHWRVFKTRFKEMLTGKSKPYKIEMTFIRDSRRKADHHNLCQLPMDLMVKHGWLTDDNMDEALVIPGNPPYGFDPKLGGVIIRII